MFSLDSRSREPIYVQLEKEIVKYINLGVYEADSPLPSVRALATELSINPNTVSKAYKNLEQHGVIYTSPGKGVFVNKTDLSVIHRETEKSSHPHWRMPKTPAWIKMRLSISSILFGREDHDRN